MDDDGLDGALRQAVERWDPLRAAEPGLPEYADLVPQIVITFPEKGLRLNLLHANHRAARMFQQMARRLTGRSDPAKKDSFLAPIMKKLRRAS